VRAGDPTQLLVESGKGDELAREALLPLIYEELRRIAGAYMRRERPDHTLQPTALVHEAYLRLVDQRRVNWTNRAQFVGMAAVMMRRILVNHARDRGAAKRGANLPVISLADADAPAAAPDLDVVALHDALDRLAAIDARKSRIVELKFFGGLTTAEIGEVLNLSHATVEREWSFARAWLYEAVAGNVK
jgi:RNA polymerase sigma factor (TIGR02999 family)